MSTDHPPVTRRQFLQTTASATAIGFAGPFSRKQC
jgi:hypothetical protein